MKPIFKNLFLVTIIGIFIFVLVFISGCSQTSPTAVQPANTAASSVSQAASTASAAPSPSPATTTRTITNMDGSTVIVPAQVDRIACLFGPSYEKVALLGGENRVVLRGQDNKSMWPWADVIYKNVKQVPVISGNAQTPNIEELIKKDVQVVFFWSTPDQIKKMNDSGLPCLYPSSAQSMLDNCKTDLQVYANLLGKDAQAKAAAYNAYFDKKKKLVTDRTTNIPDSERPAVYFAVRMALQTAGKTSQVPELVSLAGGKCVTSDLNAGFGQNITLEQLLKWNPEFIIVDHCGASSLGSAPPEKTLSDIAGDSRFEGIQAVQKNQVYISPTGVFFWDAGQQMILQLLWLAKLLHPDKFQDIDMTRELKEYYSTFFQYQLTDDQAKRILLHEPPPAQ